jgi:hypothetical protein
MYFHASESVSMNLKISILIFLPALISVICSSCLDVSFLAPVCLEVIAAAVGVLSDLEQLRQCSFVLIVGVNISATGAPLGRHVIRYGLSYLAYQSVLHLTPRYPCCVDPPFSQHSTYGLGRVSVK